MENQNQIPMGDSPVHAPVGVQMNHPNQNQLDLPPAPHMEQLQAPVAPSHEPLKSDEAFEKSKKSHVGVLLTVFAVMSGAVGYVAVKSPDLLKASVFMISADSIRPAAPASNIYTKKVWAKTATPDAMLKSDANTFRPVGGNVKVDPVKIDLVEAKVDSNTPKVQPQDDVVKVAPPVVDTDKDGVSDDLDNCPMVANTDQKDADSNKVGDACEVVPTVE